MVPQAEEPVPRPFGLGGEVVADGRFVRQASVFRRWVSADGSSGLPAEAGRYHLYVCLACPWSHRAVVVRHVKGLEAAVSMSLRRSVSRRARLGVQRRRVHRPPQRLRLSEPGLRGDRPRVRRPGHRAGAVGQRDAADRQQRVGRHHAHVQQRVRGLRQAPRRPLSRGAADRDRRGQRARLRQRQQRRLQGRLRAQPGGLRAGVRALFATLDGLEARSPRAATWSATHRPRPTGASSRRWCASTPSTTATSSATCAGSSTTRTSGATRATSTSSRASRRPSAIDQIKRHYYTTHGFLDPSGIIPVGPEIDFAAPHDRERLS